MNSQTYIYISDIFVYVGQGKIYHIDYLLIDEEENNSKQMRYKATKFKTLKAQINTLLQEYILI